MEIHEELHSARKCKTDNRQPTFSPTALVTASDAVPTEP
jgi:hypothetical protein